MRNVFAIVSLLFLMACGGARSGSVGGAARAFDSGAIDRGCELARATFRRPHSARDTIQLPQLLDRCAFELAARENTRPALEGYLSGAPSNSHWAPIARRQLCDVDPAYPGCDKGSPDIPDWFARTPNTSGPTNGPSLPSLEEPLRTGAERSLDAALVIGLERYPFATDVPFAMRDAQAFADHLRYTIGVPDHRIEVVTSGSVEAMREAAKRVAERTKSGGTLWFYFAGHGASHPVTRERLLLGDDLRPDAVSLGSRGTPVEGLIRQARGNSSKAIAVLDTCFTGTGRDGAPLVEGARFLIPSSSIRSNSIIEWSSTGPGEVAMPLQAQRHGAFTFLVLGALRGWADGEIDGVRDGKVTLQEASVYVRRKLRHLGFDGMSAPVAATDEMLKYILVEPAPEHSPEF
ncbi:MAG: hypothetical protein EA397_08920 [Deltaproteobacteria bacterium]|nr:MAG: hypothetical protein EA397_08920 [Deltaproteobacteria bacterium]